MTAVNPKNIVRPKTWNPRDVYQQYAEQLLNDNPHYWGKYSKPGKMKNFWIYTKIGSKVVEVINYNRWKNIATAYFLSARTFITRGEVLNLGNHLGKIEPRRVERNHENKRINFLATSKRPKVIGEDGIARPDMIVYYIGDDWVRIAWVRTKHITNERSYKFSPCTGDEKADGFKEQFSDANIQNQMLKFNYKYYPYIKRERKMTA